MCHLRSIRPVLLGAVVALFALAPDGASASSVGVYFALDTACCDVYVPAPFTLLNWYVLAVLDGGDAVASGIAGGAFRVTGAPTNWFHVVHSGPGIPEPPPGNLLNEGVEFGLTCQSGTNRLVLLFSISSFVTSIPSNVVLTAERPQLPNYTGFDCPVLFACDASFTPVCVPGTSAYINGPRCHDYPCTISVAPNTWGMVKTLYQR